MEEDELGPESDLTSRQSPPVKWEEIQLQHVKPEINKEFTSSSEQDLKGTEISDGKDKKLQSKPKGKKRSQLKIIWK